MKRNGFTLIELMIVVAIVAILGSIALPAYTSYLARGKITDGLAALADYRIKMEQYFQDHRDYGTAGGSCSVAAATSSNFSFTCTVGNPNTTFSAQASSLPGSLGSAAGAYTYAIDQSNAKSTSKFKGNSVTNSCWLIRGDEC